MTAMQTLSRIAPWVQRFVLAAVTLIFGMIGLRYILNPVGSAAAVGMQLTSALATTTLRVAAGAFPLALSIASLVSLTSSRFRRTGVALIALLLAVVIAVRFIGLMQDGPAAASTRLFAPEGVIFALCAVSWWLERGRSEPA